MKDLTINAATAFDLPPAFSGRHLIDGQWRGSAESFDRVSPSHDVVVSTNALGEVTNGLGTFSSTLVGTLLGSVIGWGVGFGLELAIAQEPTLLGSAGGMLLGGTIGGMVSYQLHDANLPVQDLTFTPTPTQNGWAFGLSGRF
ncbi:MAG: hypothetical protein AAF658_15585 [Myxococcota bacterium]